MSLLNYSRRDQLLTVRKRKQHIKTNLNKINAIVNN